MALIKWPDSQTDKTIKFNTLKTVGVENQNKNTASLLKYNSGTNEEKEDFP